MEGPRPADPPAARLDAAARRRDGRVRRAGVAGRVHRLLFVGFFSFFLGKISADTIVQQAMPDDFRGGRSRCSTSRTTSGSSCRR
jgi:hypothetical protein